MLTSCQSQRELRDWPYLLSKLDEGYGWTTVGEGYVRCRQYRGRAKKSSTNTDDHIASNEEAFRQMKGLCFEDCPTSGGYPETLRTFEMLDSRASLPRSLRPWG